jgi:hypothetical protein
LTVRQGQTTEEEWFSNSELSIGLEKFMNTMGKPVKLKDYKGYAAGLDTKSTVKVNSQWIYIYTKLVLL